MCSYEHYSMGFWFIQASQTWLERGAYMHSKSVTWQTCRLSRSVDSSMMTYELYNSRLGSNTTWNLSSYRASRCRSILLSALLQLALWKRKICDSRQNNFHPKNGDSDLRFWKQMSGIPQLHWQGDWLSWPLETVKAHPTRACPVTICLVTT